MSRPQPSARGDLAKTPFAHLLIYGLEKKLTGSLELTAPDGRVNTVLLKEGFPTKARTADAVAYLGRVLLELGLVGESAVNATLLEVAKTKRLHGQLLLDRGAVSEAGLAKGLESQLRRRLAHLFALPAETTFAFYAKYDALADWGGEAVARVDPLPVVWRAIREAPPWEHVHGTLARVQNNKLRLAANAQPARLELDTDAAALVERLRAQPMRPAELASLGVASPRVTQLLVYVLLVTKQVDLGETVAASPPAAGVRPSQPPPAPRRISTPPRAPMGSAPGFREPASSYPGFVSAPGTGPLPTRTSMGTGPLPTRTSMGTGPLPTRTSTGSFPVRRDPRIAAPTPPPGSMQAIPKPGALPSFSTTGGREIDLAVRQVEIRERAASIDKQDYFEMLGVPRTATVDEVKSAFFALAKKWHPDRLPKELEGVRDECARVFSRLGEAHTALADADQRQNYMRLLAEGGATPEDQETIIAVIEAAQNFQKAEIHLRRNDLAQAEMLCRKAHDADGKQPDYLALLAWIEAQKPECQTPKATLERVAMLDRAAHLGENCEKAYFYRAMLHKRMGNDRLAARDFRKSVELNPRNIDATREVRLYEMRKQRNTTAPPPPASGPGARQTQAPDAKGGGILNKLFKR